MSKLFEDTFGASYHASVVTEPDYALLILCYPGAVEGLVEGLGVKFFPREGVPWYGTFASGSLSRNAVSFAGSCPDKVRAIVISKGEGYVVNVDQPDDWSSIPLLPVMGVVSDAEQQVIIAWDYIRMLCIDQNGIRWKTRRISWDGIKDVTVHSNEIRASVWDPPKGCFRAATIDLATGTVTSGLNPPPLDGYP